MSETFDVVVAGGGHNSLVTAAYLAKAGYEVCVLEARELAGGGAVTEELTLPGYLFDSCSTGHTLLQPNPLMRDDELGLKSEYGLEYISPDPIAHVVFPDGESFTHWLDLDRTCATLSAGEAQRLKLASLLGGELTGMTVLLDEPSRGLHPSEVAALGDELLALRDQGNTVLLVEHDRELIERADEVVVLGPGAGRAGGKVVAQGGPRRLARTRHAWALGRAEADLANVLQQCRTGQLVRSEHFVAIDAAFLIDEKA